MKIVLNGKVVEVEKGLSVAELVAQKNFSPNMVIIEHNQQLLKKDVWPQIKLQNNDKLEIFQLVGGG